MHWVRTTALLFAIAIATTSVRADDYDVLRTRWREMLTFGTNAVTSDPLYAPWISTLVANATSYLNSMSNGPTRTYLWKSYDNLSNNSSDITGSYSRLRTMALAYSVHGSSLKGDTNLRNAIISGLDWMNANYYTPTGAVYDNWFDFNIATPLALNDTVVLLYSNLSPAQITAYMASVDHYTPVPDLTAANKVWKAMAIALRGVIVKDSAKIDLARSALSDVFPNVTTGDGFYADGSFIFHNFFPYNGGYGVEMLDTLGSLMQLLKDSAWPISDPAQTNIFRWIQDGYQPFIFKGSLMPLVDGRYHTRTGNDHAEGHDLLGAVLRIAQIAPLSDAASYKSFVKGAIKADTSRSFVASELPPYNVWASAILNDVAVPTVVETSQHRQFPSMDRIVHKTPTWAFGLAMSSSRVANYESTRGENLRGWFTAEGMTYLHNGDLTHYTDNFWATVDPYRLPGTTVDTVIRTNGSGDSYRPSQPLPVGGASIQGLFGVAAMHLNAWNSTLSARKGWFMFDNEIVCLGNSVSSTDGRGSETIVENRRLNFYGNNAFTVNGATKPSSPGWAETMNTVAWAHLAGSVPGADIGYYFPTVATVKAARESRSGSLYELNTTYGTTNRSTRHYLSMSFDHGTNPSSGTYSYVLLPNKTAAEVAAYAAAPEISVVANNSQVQCVRKSKLGITAVNFWRDQSNSVAGVSSDRRSCVILRNDGALLDIGVSEPTQTNTGIITVELATAASAVIATDPGISVLQVSPTIRLAINASNRLGATLRAKFALGAIQTNAFQPLADAYVQNGPQSPTNFGLATTLAVKTNATPGQTREAFLRFDLSSLTGQIMAANLKLVPTTVADPLIHGIAPVGDNSWGETNIVWTNKPASLAEYAQWVAPMDLSPVTVPITSLAQQAIGSDGKLSLRVYSTGTPTATNGGFTAYASQQHPTAASRPQLAVMTMRLPPAVMLSTSSDLILNAPGAVNLMANAQDPDGFVSSVEFYCGSTRLDQILVPPYSITVPNLVPGSYSFTAVATDNTGLSTTSAPVTVSVYAPQSSGRGSGLNVDYFSDLNLTTLALSRIETNINLQLGVSASPAPPTAPPNFSARWSGKLQPRRSGLHYFHSITDEGVRLWIDGKLVIDNWAAHFQTEDTGSISLIADRYYDIVMEFYDASLSAIAQLYWTPPGESRELVPQSQLYPADQGLRGIYYSGTNFSAPVLTRIDESISFNWGTNSPEPTLLTGAFSARWTGKLRAHQTGNYSLFASSDDAVRISLNGQFVISNWVARTLTEDSNSVSLVAGQYYDVVIEYYNASGSANLVLMWTPPGESKQLIPPSAFTTHRNNSAPTLAPIQDILGASGALISVAAAATDADVPAQSLSYSLDSGAPVGATVNPSTGVFSWALSNAQTPGTYAITLRVTDNGSPEMTAARTFKVLVLTNMSAALLTVIPTGATWQYLDTGVDQGTAWRNATFNTSSWKTGRTRFGFGFGDETTVTSFGTNANAKYPTTYFRTSFYVPDPALIQSLTLRLARDDGAVLHLNGAEVWRDNMPTGTVSFSTLASSELTDTSQTQYLSKSISPSVLVMGTNVLAVELHQASSNTVDARFDLEVTANAFVPADAQVVATRSGTVTQISWPTVAGLLQPYMATNLTPPVSWQRITNAPIVTGSQWVITLPISSNTNCFFRLQSP